MSRNELATRRLRDVVHLADELAEIVRGRAFDDVERDNLPRRGVERLIEIVGEATSQAVEQDPSLRSQIANVRNIIGMRNRLAHGYDAIDDVVVWQAATINVPLLADEARALLGKEVEKRSRWSRRNVKRSATFFSV
jgi:uncharacterized protein with HEPN domain